MTSPQTIREAIIAAPFELDNTGEIPRPGTLYIPPAHRKALSQEAVLVVGARGVGKSFWTAALGDNDLRRQLGGAVKELASTTIQIGHAAKSNSRAYPDRETFKGILAKGHDPYAVWRTVVARWLAAIVGESVTEDSWVSSVRWAENNPEQIARIVEKANQKLLQNNQSGLIVFDALDRTSDDWETMNHIVRDLLRVVLWLRDFSNLRAKVFLRPDQLERTVTTFVDASKLLATRADLTWERHDLHAMMWQRLINAPNEHGKCLRAVVCSVLPTTAKLNFQNDAWILPSVITSEHPHQRPLFESLAGDKMGKDARRGVPYVWSVSHLADGHGWTSPRSFLAAVSAAAEDSQRYTDYPLALHYESLKRGIQKASQIRVAQVAEDDPWVTEVMLPLKGSNVPREYDGIRSAWEEAFPQGSGSISTVHLPPQHAGSWEGVCKDLERLGVFVNRKDGRIDMPDLYRVGFGLGRKGGVKPKN
ncbi:hypothetical protein D5125_15765 [Magnetovirga frankeli]|uniref:hypothetical protein n=1 Tax=Magnetovirga frankeli TaxID=947516 RepID=UPI001293AE1C|nr:hypothetical protein D5125_15765 [gamma proteobacterium SS-5]